MATFTISCEECVMRDTDTCDDCVVTYLCDRPARHTCGARPRHCPHGEAARSGRPCPPPDTLPAERSDADGRVPCAVRAPTSSLTKRCLAAGRGAGLDAVGVAPAQPFTRSSGTRIAKAAGLHGGMAFTYKNPARSTDPGAALDGARSIVVEHFRMAKAHDPRRRAAERQWSPATPGATTTDFSPTGLAPSPRI